MRFSVPNLDPLSSITSLFFSSLIFVCKRETEISVNFISHSLPLPFYKGILLKIRKGNKNNWNLISFIEIDEM